MNELVSTLPNYSTLMEIYGVGKPVVHSSLLRLAMCPGLPTEKHWSPLQTLIPVWISWADTSPRVTSVSISPLQIRNFWWLKSSTSNYKNHFLKLYSKYALSRAGWNGKYQHHNLGKNPDFRSKINWLWKGHKNTWLY